MQQSLSIFSLWVFANSLFFLNLLQNLSTENHFPRSYATASN